LSILPWRLHLINVAHHRHLQAAWSRAHLSKRHNYVFPDGALKLGMHPPWVHRFKRQNYVFLKGAPHIPKLSSWAHLFKRQNYVFLNGAPSCQGLPEAEFFFSTRPDLVKFRDFAFWLTPKPSALFQKSKM